MKFLYWVYALVVILITTMVNLGEGAQGGRAWGGGHSSGSWSSSGGHK